MELPGTVRHVRWNPTTVRWAVAVGWIAVTVVLSLLPGGMAPVPHVARSDVVLHFAVYAAMAFALHRALRRPTLRCGLAVTAACGALGVALELAQAFVPGRALDLWDAAANVIGAAAASAVYVWQAGRRKREA